MYKDAAYANSRLANTIIRTKRGSPFMALEAKQRGGDIVITSSPLKGGGIKEVPLKDCDLTPVPLGFVNFRGCKQAAYMTRIPLRQDWRQGLRAEQVRYIYGKNVDGHPRKLPNNSNLYDVIKGNYPLYGEAYNMLFDDGGAVAFDRQFALSKIGIDAPMEIIYRNKPIAVVNPMNRRHEMKHNYYHLKEKLDEILERQAA